MEYLVSLYEKVREVIDYPLFYLGKNPINLSLILFVIISITLLFLLASFIKRLLQNRILARYNVDIGVRQSVSTIIRYVIIVIGLTIIIQATGIDLSFLAIIAGALGIGIGFGLQNITNNFVSGLVILFERPIKVGDRIEVITESDEKISGDVIDISSRATTIITNDNISIIVPNSNLISSTVINWSHNDRKVRFNFKVPVHYKENPETVKKLLVEVALENDGVLKSPPPDVLFDDFGDSELVFILRVWTSKYIQKPGVLRSQLYYAVYKKFNDNNIEIPFPQRDLHLKSGFEKIGKSQDKLKK
ncbi:MAG: mechanosensitive ion channel [Bacteroidetes bacterium]|nr:mechanosensitive ion channel [Bacteroidota bacterium]